MKKSDLKDGMIIQTEHNRFGVVEMKKNRINICYAPGYIHDEDAKLHLEMLSLDDVYECEDGSLVVGFILTEEMKNKAKRCYEENNVGDLIIAYEITSVYGLSKIYGNGEWNVPKLYLE